MDNTVAALRGPALEDDEEEDDWNPEAEVGSDAEEEQTKNEDGDETRVKASRSPSKRRSQSAAASRHQSMDRETDMKAIGPRDGEDDAEGRDVADRQPRSQDNVEDDIGGKDDADGEDEDGNEDGPNEDDDGEGDGDEDEDEDEEDDDEEIQSHRQKRRKRNRNQFIDVEAEVDEEDEEEDEEDDLPEGFVAEEHPDDEALPPGEISDDRAHRQLDRQRQQAEDLSAEQIAARYSERYADYGKSRGAAIDSATIPQRLLLPSVEDPTIWGVRCRPGKEREIVFAITKRIEQRYDTATPLRINSAFERGNQTMAGFIYVEARTKADVKAAVENITNVFAGKDMVLVPIQEMPDLLKTMKSKSIDPGMWVRIKRGKYQGDLAYVEEVQENGSEVELKIVPREDYGLNEDTNAPLASSAEGSKRKRANAFGRNILATRAPPRLFNENEARKRHGRYVEQIDNLSAKRFRYQGNQYVNGFLHKSFRVNLLQTEDVNPTLEEVSKFTSGHEEGGATMDLQKLAATLKQTSADSYLPGDDVEIYSGEQRGVTGKAAAVHGDIVSIKVTEGQLKGATVDAPVKDLRKRFREGDHVKVIGGSKYLDEVGMVVRILDTRITLLSDASNQEITVFSKDLRAATDAGTSRIGGKYDLHDLVQLDQATVGVVIKVDRESLRVLDQEGTVRNLLPSAISGQLERRKFAVSTDKDGTEIRNDDTVREIGGDQRQGRVMHIHRAYLFIHSRNQTENASVFVVKSRQVLTVAANGGRAANAGPDLTKMNPTTQRPGLGNGSGAMPPPKPMMGRDRMLGKTCTIRKGPYKGLLGIIKDTSETDARVELHTKNKVITVSKDILAIKDPITGANMDLSRFGGPLRSQFSGAPAAGSQYSGAATPGPWNAGGYSGGRTPAAYASGGKTPAWGAAAPAWGGATSYGGAGAAAAGGRTPGWRTSAGAGQTAWGAGGRTPAAFNDGSRTQYAGWNDGSRTAYGGGRTPGWAMDGGKTPLPHSFEAPPPASNAPPYGTAGGAGNDEGYE